MILCAKNAESCNQAASRGKLPRSRERGRTHVFASITVSAVTRSSCCDPFPRLVHAQAQPPGSIPRSARNRCVWGLSFVDDHAVTRVPLVAGNFLGSDGLYRFSFRHPDLLAQPVPGRKGRGEGSQTPVMISPKRWIFRTIGLTDARLVRPQFVILRRTGCACDTP
jgi:hypothetical protein